MPKGAAYHISWEEQEQAYVLRHAPFSFVLSEQGLSSWLKLIEAFHFQASSGEGLTVRKETKQRGTAYWYAYRRVEGKLRKKYLGDTSKITLTVLESMARAFASAPEPEAPPPRQPVFQFTHTLASALAIFDFAKVPTKAACLARYRELVKQHHPDRGGVHQDMVAVNLAYELLKHYVS